MMSFKAKISEKQQNSIIQTKNPLCSLWLLMNEKRNQFTLWIFFLLKAIWTSVGDFAQRNVFWDKKKMEKEKKIVFIDSLVFNGTQGQKKNEVDMGEVSTEKNNKGWGQKCGIMP